MATRKCGNIYFPKYFMAVRPFLTRKFFQEILGLEGSKISWEKKNVSKISKVVYRYRYPPIYRSIRYYLSIG